MLQVSVWDCGSIETTTGLEVQEGVFNEGGSWTAYHSRGILVPSAVLGNTSSTIFTNLVERAYNHQRRELSQNRAPKAPRTEIEFGIDLNDYRRQGSRHNLGCDLMK